MKRNEGVARDVASHIRRVLPDGGLILLTGLGAAGKTTFSSELADALEHASVFHSDGCQFRDAHRRGVTLEDGTSPTGCHPQAYDHALLQDCLKTLKAGGTVAQLHSDGVLPHDPSSQHVVSYIHTSRWNIVEGLCAVHEFEKFDFSIFLDCSLEEERRRRFKRDISRGKDPADVEKIFKVRRAQYEEHILPYRARCDVRLVSNTNYEILVDEPLA